jgi:hypothetical protein
MRTMIVTTTWTQPFWITTRHSPTNGDGSDAGLGRGGPRHECVVCGTSIIVIHGKVVATVAASYPPLRANPYRPTNSKPTHARNDRSTAQAAPSHAGRSQQCVIRNLTMVTGCGFMSTAVDRSHHSCGLNITVWGGHSGRYRHFWRRFLRLSCQVLWVGIFYGWPCKLSQIACFWPEIAQATEASESNGEGAERDYKRLSWCCHFSF